MDKCSYILCNKDISLPEIAKIYGNKSKVYLGKFCSISCYTLKNFPHLEKQPKNPISGKRNFLFKKI